MISRSHTHAVSTRRRRRSPASLSPRRPPSPPSPPRAQTWRSTTAPPTSRGERPCETASRWWPARPPSPRARRACRRARAAARCCRASSPSPRRPAPDQRDAPLRVGLVHALLRVGQRRCWLSVAPCAAASSRHGSVISASFSRKPLASMLSSDASATQAYDHTLPPSCTWNLTGAAPSRRQIPPRRRRLRQQRLCQFFHRVEARGVEPCRSLGEHDVVARDGRPEDVGHDDGAGVGAAWLRPRAERGRRSARNYTAGTTEPSSSRLTRREPRLWGGLCLLPAAARLGMDRTAEFQRIIAERQSRRQGASSSSAPPPTIPGAADRTEFAAAASQWQRFRRSPTSWAKQLAQSRSLFDEEGQGQEISALTFIIKQDITALGSRSRGCSRRSASGRAAARAAGEPLGQRRRLAEDAADDGDEGLPGRAAHALEQHQGAAGPPQYSPPPRPPRRRRPAARAARRRLRRPPPPRRRRRCRSSSCRPARAAAAAAARRAAAASTAAAARW